MPESFNDRSPTPSASPKPARQGGAQGAANSQPSASGKPAGGTDSPRVTPRTISAPDSRPTTSSLKATRAAVSTFKPDAV